MSIYSLNNPKRHLAKQFKSKLKSLIYLLDKLGSREVGDIIRKMKEQGEFDSKELFTWEEIKSIANKYVYNKAVVELTSELSKIVDDILA